MTLVTCYYFEQQIKQGGGKNKFTLMMAFYDMDVAFYVFTFLLKQATFFEKIMFLLNNTFNQKHGLTLHQVMKFSIYLMEKCFFLRYKF